ncbi:MAG: thiamine phosphate synthase [Tannerella sp.]|jgi:thiamine-phosphate pyrophosphorylase|nr:thiamine phosphate synthase [Tannerella sp.]
MEGLLFITHRTERYDYLQSVEIALEGGCRQIQLRMKDVPAAKVEETALHAKTLCNRYRAALYIDDHVDVCRKVGATGVHLGKQDMPPAEARAVLGNKYVIGGTANTFEDICMLYKQGGVDYIGLGPFRFTATKKNLSPVLGLEGYRTIIKRCRENGIFLPVLAIGGITIADIPGIMQTGVSGIALSSTILNAENPVEETGKIIALTSGKKTANVKI